MAKIRVCDASGPALNWLVAKCENKDADIEYKGGNLWYGRAHFGYVVYTPSTDWAQGGPIIEREHIHTGPHTYGLATVVLNSWTAIIGFDPDGGEHLFQCDGPTPLIAAMRCYITSRLGKEVEIPDNLV